MKKKIFFLVILFGFLALIYSGGNAKDVPMKDIEKQLVSETDIEKMAKCSNRNLMQFFGVDYEQYNEFIYYKGKEALSVDELLIIKGNSKQDMTPVKDAVESRIQSQIKTYEGYGPKQVAMLKNAIVETKGDYLFYAVGKSSEKWEEVFEDVI